MFFRLKGVIMKEWGTHLRRNGQAFYEITEDQYMAIKFILPKQQNFSIGCEGEPDLISAHDSDSQVDVGEHLKSAYVQVDRDAIAMIRMLAESRMFDQAIN